VEEVEASIAALIVFCRPENLFQVFQRRSGVINLRDELKISTVGGPHQITDKGHAIDGLLERCVFHGRGPIPMFHLSVVLEKRDIVGHRLDAQDQPVFVIHLDGGLAHMMLDPSAFDPSVKIIAHFVPVSASELAAKKSSDVLGFNRVDGCPDQFLINRLQVDLTRKDDIGGVFDLHEAPMIPGFKMANDRAESIGELIELVMKSLRLDLIGQRLGFIPVLDESKGVTEHFKTDTVFLELLR